MTFPKCPICGMPMLVTSWTYCSKRSCTRLVQWARNVLRRKTATAAETRRARAVVRKVDGR